MFAGLFGLPTEGLVNLSEVPKDFVFDARCIFSQSGEPISTYGKKRLMKYEYRLLNDILDKSVTVKAGSFDAVRHERFLMMTAIHFGIQVNWSKILFGILKGMVDKTLKKAKGFAAQTCVLLKGDPTVTMGEAKTFPLKILSAKTVKTYIATNETIDARGKADEPGVAKITKSKKRPIATGDEKAVTKNKWKSKRKASSSKENMDIVSVAQEAIPLQIFEPSTAVSVDKRTTVEEAVGKQSDEPTADIIERETVSTADEVDSVIAQVLAETEQKEETETAEREQPLEIGVGEETVVEGQAVVKADEVEHWFNFSYEEYAARQANRLVESYSETYGEQETVSYETGVGEQQLQTFDETASGIDASTDYFVTEPIAGMELADVIPTIEENTSADEAMTLEDIILTITDEGNDLWKPLPGPVAPSNFEVSRQLSYVDTLPPVSEFFKMMRKRWADVCIEAIELFVSGTLLPVGSLNFCRALTVVQPVSEFGFRRSTVTSWGWSQLCTAFLRYSLFGGFSTVDIHNFVSAIDLDRSVFREATNFYSVVQRAPILLLSDSSTQENPLVHMDIDQRPNSPSTSANSFMRFDEDVTAATQFSIPAISTDLTEAFDQLRASVEQIHFEQIRHLDGKVATVRSELLDFRAKVEENHLNLSTQLGFLVDYINRGGDTKKGEGGSSSRPQPPLDDQSKPVGEMEAEQMIRADLVEAVSVEKVEAEVVVVIKEETTEVVQREGDLIVEVVNRELNREFLEETQKGEADHHGEGSNCKCRLLNLISFDDLISDAIIRVLTLAKLRRLDKLKRQRLV
ncbi:hypothetical protein F511_09654 [Dorcoceras hygrometricum]|uniref:Uncharacterized protein n=1 Tax=Dorcoceras hygrometricum TaxID=472368 RepID=A0A2Z7AB38_9LAMI|nr:hypothetical protein F511_09654 [Dorcoceras hygrometricum]